MSKWSKAMYLYSPFPKHLSNISLLTLCLMAAGLFLLVCGRSGLRILRRKVGDFYSLPRQEHKCWEGTVE